MIRNGYTRHYKAILTCSLAGMIGMTIPTTAMGAGATEERVLSHYEESLAPPKVAVSRDANAIEGLLKTTKRNLTSNMVARGQILLDLSAWIDSHPYSDLTDRVLMIRADAFQQDGSKHLALLDWLRIKVLFPSSRYASKANRLVRETIQEDKYKRDRETLESILKRNFEGKTSYRHARLLESLSALSGTYFREPLAHEYRVFLANSRAHELAPLVQKLLAENRAMTEVREALFQYETLVSVYPRSPYVADALLAIADFDQERFNKPDEAVKGYQKVINNYPKQVAARQAYYNLAVTYERHLGDEAKAIETLKKLVRQYPRTAEASKGGEMLGRLYEKTKQYQNAVAAYRDMVNVSRDNDAVVNALVKAALIAEGKLENYRLMVDINKQLCRSYPHHDACAEAHFRNGKAYEKNLANPKEAIGEYRLVVKNFPDHRLAKKASSRIKSLNGGGSGLGLF